LYSRDVFDSQIARTVLDSVCRYPFCHDTFLTGRLAQHKPAVGFFSSEPFYLLYINGTYELIVKCTEATKPRQRLHLANPTRVSGQSKNKTTPIAESSLSSSLCLFRDRFCKHGFKRVDPARYTFSHHDRVFRLRGLRL